MKNIFVIGLGHKKGVGKDTAAARLQDKHRFYKVSFADSLKLAAKEIFGFTNKQLYGDQKETVDLYWNKTPREILQLMGSDALRNVIDLDIWIKSLALRVQRLADNDPSDTIRVVIPDVRYPNEAEAIKNNFNGYFDSNYQGFIGKIIRDSQVKNEFSNHISETALDDYKDWDFVIDNNTNMASLYSKMDEALATLNQRNEKNVTLNRRSSKVN